jgi:hypothetical protein
MVHAVHHAVSVGAQVVRTLKDPRQYKKDLFPEFIHRKGVVRSVPMQEKRLEKQGQVPVPNKKCKNYGHLNVDCKYKNVFAGPPRAFCL